MSQNKFLKIPVKGMHCRSCELLIEEGLQEIEGVNSVKTDYQKGEATIYYQGAEPSLGLVKKAVVSAGYQIGREEELTWISQDVKEYRNLGVAFLILLGIYLILKALGLTGVNINSNLSNPGFGLVIMIGLVAGFSTCMALVGGLSLGLSTKFLASHPEATAKQKFRPHLFFIGGRVVGYALLGGILGMLGSAFKLSALTNSILTIAVAMVMLVMGLQLVNIFPRLSKFKFTLPKNISKALGFSQKSKEYSHGRAMFLGALTFFLPCGFTQAMQLYAVSTGNFWSGFAVMGLFALGTAPGLLSIGGLTSLVKGLFKERFFKVAGLALIIFALFNLHNAYVLAGFSGNSINSVKSEKVVNDPNVTMEDGVQVVRMIEGNRGYSPNKFSIKKDVPVKWIIDAQAPYSCASSLVLPKMNIEKTLEAGENIIEFTPTETGKLPFSCSMGMYTGVFNVYDENSTASLDTVSSKVAARTSGGSCGMTRSSGDGSCGGSGATGGGCGCGGGGAKVKTSATETPAAPTSEVQVIKTSYTLSKDIQPNDFKVKVGKPVRFEVAVKEDGVGCMSQIEIQGLYEKPQLLEAGKTLVMEFTPQTPGEYLIVCPMGVVRGWLKVE
ncbi:MAG: sulfite exporter TauE/SafE family protein [Candidatus Falkowbacteria bacterium]|nr:sulfite exporter TauE/SafE family protein [Candidatus Falkowbacteria bacterium]